MAWRRWEGQGWESKEANFTDNDWWEERRFGTETLSDRKVWMTPYSPWWRSASDVPLPFRRRDTARQGCPVHLEGGTWSSTNPSTQTLWFKRRFRYTVGAATYIYTYTEGIANDGSTTLSGPELSVEATTSGRRDHHDTTQRDPWSTSNYGRKGGRWWWSSSRWGETADCREWTTKGTTTQQRATSSATQEQGELPILAALVDFPDIIVGITKYLGLEGVKLWSLQTERILAHRSRVLDLWMEGLFASAWVDDTYRRVPQITREADPEFQDYRSAQLACSQMESDRDHKSEFIDSIARRAGV